MKYQHLYLPLVLLLCFFALFGFILIKENHKSGEYLPVAFEGRFRPLIAVAMEKYPDANPEASMKLLWDAQFLKVDEAFEEHLPLRSMLLKNASHSPLILPGNIQSGEWYPLHKLVLKIYKPSTKKMELISNFTLYSPERFSEIQKSYLTLLESQTDVNFDKLIRSLDEGYREVEGKPYRSTATATWNYPTYSQLFIEFYYLTTPWVPICICFYALALITLILLRNSFPAFGLMAFLIAFLLHSIILAARIYVLERPPVSNMFETLLFVPWVTALLCLIFSIFLPNRLLLIFGTCGIITLLLLGWLHPEGRNLENVQAVLASNYWLTIHVMLVVASYGLFLLSSLAGHCYLLIDLISKKSIVINFYLSKILLQSMYIGIAFLIGGTILGGVWAAQSWGRFWDWDPKESWAFISSCIYLLWIHAYRFGFIKAFGLAIGAVVGFVAITFTWYGVNYLLGTGLHSYGFGSGGVSIYLLYIFLEIIFLGCVLFLKKRQQFYNLI